jgi:hypothetical protein
MPAERPISGDLDSLVRQACSELRRQLEAGQDARAESFIEALPLLASDPERALDLILTEFEARRQRGETLDLQQWLDRFPQWKDALRRQFAVQEFIADATPPGTVADQTDVHPGGGPSSSVSPPACGAMFAPGRLEILEQLGRGGMGVVYKARDTVLGRHVALKVLPATLLDEPGRAERFEREVRAAAQLSHPNLVPILDVGQYEGQPCYAMPLIEGGTLARCLEKYREARDAVVLIEKVARGVQVAHAKGIVHRDLKPGNILLDERGEPLVADFGLARFVDASVDITRPGQQVGTPAYMSPEQAAGKNDLVGPASDVWALGVILYQMLTGKRPFPGQSNPEVIQQILATDPPRPRSVERSVPANLEAVVLECLDKEPGRRYTDAGALADDLRRWLNGEPVRARRASWVRGGWIAARRYRWVVAAAVLLGVVVLAAPYLKETPPDPDRGIKEQIARLERGEAATLIGETGGPVRVRWIAGQGAVQEHIAAAEGAFLCHSMTLALLELLPRQPLPCFRLRAQIRHVDSARGGRVGLYALHRTREAARGTEHLLYDFTFNDADKDSPRNIGPLVRLYLPRGPKGSDNQICGRPFSPLNSPVVPRGKEGPWQNLDVVVTPKRVEARLNGKMIHTWPQAELTRDFRSLFDDDPAAAAAVPPLSAQGGVGLFVWRATAAFRRVVVEPLPPDDD